MKNSVKSCLAHNRIKGLYIAGILFLGISAMLGITLGSTTLSFSDIADAFLYGFNTSAGTRIFAYVRLPRTLASLTCGAALAVSGAVIQGVLSNRLASPSIIGVNAGAGLAVTLCTALGIVGGWQLSAFSFLGAFGAVMLVSLGAKRWGASRGTVILIGVALNSLLCAVSDTITTFLPEVGVMSNDFKIGAFSAMEQVGISELAAKPLHTLSGGMRQNAYIAMALAQDTAYVLLDEPTTYLDISHQLELMKQLRALGDSGKGIVAVMHDLPMALTFSDRVVLLHDGQIVSDGAPEQVCRQKTIDSVFGVAVKRLADGQTHSYEY